MADGSTKPIEDVELGEFVLATDPLTGETSAQEVKDLITGEGQKDLVTISTDSDGDGTEESIEATAGHPLYTANRGWLNAGDLEIGDLLVGADGTVIEVTDLSAETRIATVHNLTIDRIPSYYVIVDDRPALVHNCKGPSQSPAWQGLKAHRGKTKTNGAQGKKREYYEWDYTHNNIEVYNRRGHHSGVMDPMSGAIDRLAAVAGRRINL